MIIAIDGPSASGKSSLARVLAERLELAYLDTGLLYRAVGLAITCTEPINTSVVVKAAEAICQPSSLSTLKDHVGFRSEEAGQAASYIASIPEVREVLTNFQRRFAFSPPDGKIGSVIDGRDIGTVVFPEADCKLFVTASLQVRAQRRARELKKNTTLTAVDEQLALERINSRDLRDSKRYISPLKPARDAFILDTSEMDIHTVLTVALAYVSLCQRKR